MQNLELLPRLEVTMLITTVELTGVRLPCSMLERIGFEWRSQRDRRPRALEWYRVQLQVKPLSPRSSPTSRNTTLLAATSRYCDRVPSISQVAEKVSDAVG